MIKAHADIYIDKYRTNKNGECSVKIKITYNGRRKYFSTGINLTHEDFQKLFNVKRKTDKQKTILIKLNYFLSKANDVIDKLDVFNFDTFCQSYLDKRNTTKSVSFAFDQYILELNNEKRLGTASSYKCARNSLEKFSKNLTFGEISPFFLKKYENWMLENNRSITTVGIYLRSLRAVFNLQNMPQNSYPFGVGKNKYRIPTSKNIKKALSIDEVKNIYDYPAEAKSAHDQARDYWIFLYLTGGMNVKDFCMLKWDNIEENVIRYRRAKTQRNTKECKFITIDLKPETIEIIKKWGNSSISNDTYVFPHLQPNMTAEKQRAVYQGLTKRINKYIKLIAKEIGLNKNVTTYAARHSFATILKSAHVAPAMISDLLGHTNITSTESYFDGFEDFQIKQSTEALTAGF